MTLKFSQISDQPESSTSPCVIVGVFADGDMSAAAIRVDNATSGAIKRLLDSSDITTKLGSSSLLFWLSVLDRVTSSMVPPSTRQLLRPAEH